MKNESGISSGNGCPVCEGRHDLDNCRKFNDLTLEERSKILRKKKLCYGCYSPITSEHNAKSCKKRRKCQVCNLDHPTELHGYIHKKKGGALTNDIEQKQGGSNLKSNFGGMDLKSASANITPNFISMCVLLVKVSYAGTKKQISTYAMLDNCSQGCFVKDSIIKNLGADGRKTEITIKALNGEQKMKSTVMSGLKVRSDSDEDTKRWLDLPATYTKEELPADVEEVATREKIEIWDHLRRLPTKSQRFPT